MRRNWNFEKRSILTKETFGYLIGIMALALVYSLLFKGCANSEFKTVESLECIDGSLYKVSKQRVELVYLNSCDEEKIAAQRKW